MQGGVFLSLSELRTKDVVNTRDGKLLGKVMDIEFCLSSGQVEAIVVPGETNFMLTLRGEKCGIVIPWNRIIKIGDDVILVDVDPVCA